MFIVFNLRKCLSIMFKGIEILTHRSKLSLFLYFYDLEILIMYSFLMLPVDGDFCWYSASGSASNCEASEAFRSHLIHGLMRCDKCILNRPKPLFRGQHLVPPASPRQEKPQQPHAVQDLGSWYSTFSAVLASLLCPWCWVSRALIGFQFRGAESWELGARAEIHLHLSIEYGAGDGENFPKKCGA